MKKLSTIICTVAMAAALAGCSSSSAASSTASAAASASAHAYESTADTTALNFASVTFHDVTVTIPNEWSGRSSSKLDEMDYTIKGSNDKIELLYTEGVTASDALFDKLTTSEPWTTVSTDTVTVNGTEYVHAKGTSIIYNVIQMDASADMYLIPDGTGVVALITIQDPEGTVDMTPVFEKVVNSISVK